ncbi:sterile alpha motif domain-containing protein 13 isoform X1 [Hemiscyllium ocellatum]|uniref:sterile alpha motif domain-containing protein 13 isoform X1 n=3 Tax=Hemiscyllium ocellatum TaxID=170820 RepID=UPI002965F789|nr:sterile alpha motif domain-containing protein 13 isoform X1 [Hemiscyllium ocellatum]
MEMQYKEWILETIDSLRTRKARPDVERICRMIERKYGLSPAETQQQLEKLVRAELVIKVAYKGSNSYRNAAKWYKNKQRKKPAPASPGDGAPASVTPVAGSRSILQAVSELHKRSQRRHPPQPQHLGCQQQPDRYSSPSQPPEPGQQQEEGAPDEGWRGVSLRDIERHLAAAPPHAPGARRLARARLQLALKRETSRGRLLQTASGHYTLPPPPPPGPGPGQGTGRRRRKEKLEMNGAPGGGAALTPKGYTRTRKEEAIEPNALLINPPAAAASPDSECMEAELKDIEEWNSTPDLEQDVCGTESLEPTSKQNNCKNNKAPNYTHPTESSVFLNCDTYKKSRDMNSHTQDVSGHSTDQWSYGECVSSSREETGQRMLLIRLASPDPALKHDTAKEEAIPEQGAAVPELRGASCLPTPSASPVEMETIESGSTKSPTENGKLLDPAEWTILDVFNYFKKAGFEDQAVAFQEQEIDGKSLLLMKRSDVLTGLSIKLGPALKIYEYHVKALQLHHLKSSSL